MKTKLIFSFKKAGTYLVTIPLIGLSMVGTTQVFALEPSQSIVTTVKPLPTTNTSRIDTLKAKAQAEITKRITSMNNDIAKIQSNKRLSDAQKSKYISDLQSQILSLQTLQTKILADTDITILKADVQSIIASFRVYALYMPKISILVASDAQASTASKMLDLSKKLEVRILTLQNEGKNVTPLQAQYNDALAKLKDSTTQDQNADVIANALTPEGYPGNLNSLKQARADIKTASTDLHAAGDNLRNIIIDIKSLVKTNTIKPTTSSKNSSGI